MSSVWKCRSAKKWSRADHEQGDFRTEGARNLEWVGAEYFPLPGQGYWWDVVVHAGKHGIMGAIIKNNSWSINISINEKLLLTSGEATTLLTMQQTTTMWRRKSDANRQHRHRFSKGPDWMNRLMQQDIGRASSWLEKLQIFELLFSGFGSKTGFLPFDFYLLRFNYWFL